MDFTKQNSAFFFCAGIGGERPLALAFARRAESRKGVLFSREQKQITRGAGISTIEEAPFRPSSSVQEGEGGGSLKEGRRKRAKVRPPPPCTCTCFPPLQKQE